MYWTPCLCNLNLKDCLVREVYILTARRTHKNYSKSIRYLCYGTFSDSLCFNCSRNELHPTLDEFNKSQLMCDTTFTSFDLLVPVFTPLVSLGSELWRQYPSSPPLPLELPPAFTGNRTRVTCITVPNVDHYTTALIQEPAR